MRARLIVTQCIPHLSNGKEEKMSEFCYVSDARKLIVFWAPKSACSSIGEWFYYGVIQGLDGKPLGGEDARILLYKQGYAKSISDINRNAKKYASFTKIIVLRHPLTRLVSGFVNKFVLYNGRWLAKYDDLEDFAKSIVDWIYETRRWGVYTGIRFADLLEYIEDGARDNRQIDMHFKGQISERYNKRKLKLDMICKVEQLEEHINEINNMLGIRYALKRRNRTNYDVYTDEGRFLNSFSVELARKNIAPPARTLVDKETKERIYDIYQRDFETGGYDIDNF